MTYIVSSPVSGGFWTNIGLTQHDAMAHFTTGRSFNKLEDFNGIARINSLTGPLELMFYSAVDGEAALIYWDPIGDYPRALKGLFVYDASSYEEPDDNTILAGAPYFTNHANPGRWIAAWRGGRGGYNGLATLDAGGKLEQDVDASKVTGVLDASNIPGLKPVVWGRINCGATPNAQTGSVGITSVAKESNGDYTVSFSSISSNYIVHATLVSNETAVGNLGHLNVLTSAPTGA